MESFVLAKYGSGRGIDECLAALMMGCNTSFLLLIGAWQWKTVGREAGLKAGCCCREMLQGKEEMNGRFNCSAGPMLANVCIK